MQNRMKVKKVKKKVRKRINEEEKKKDVPSIGR